MHVQITVEPSSAGAEAVTHAEDTFEVPAWGPLALPPARFPTFRRRVLAPDQPALYVFKPGYVISAFAGRWDMSYTDKLFWTRNPSRVPFGLMAGSSD